MKLKFTTQQEKYAQNKFCVAQPILYLCGQLK